MQDEKTLLTVEEAATLTGLKVQTLNNWRCQHKGPAFIKISNRMVRYQREDIEEWIAECRVGPATSGWKPRVAVTADHA
jgi:predicted DNA-binding transcriptional regulator AlpA